MRAALGETQRRKLIRGDKAGEKEGFVSAPGRELRDLFEIFVIMSRVARKSRNTKKGELFRETPSLSPVFPFSAARGNKSVLVPHP